VTGISPAARVVLARLAAIEAAAIAPLLMPPARMALRDSLIRATLRRRYGDLLPTRAARALAADLAAGAPPGTIKGDAIAAILALNNGRPIKARQILNIV
jgi:hypothetical protein